MITIHNLAPIRLPQGVVERLKEECVTANNRATIDAEDFIRGHVTRDELRAARVPTACLYCSSPRRDDGTGHCPSCGAPL